MSNFIPVKRPVIRNDHLGDHRVVEPTLAAAARVPASVTAATTRPAVHAWHRRQRRRPWLLGVAAIALLAVIAWADVPDAQGRLPDPKGGGDEAPFVLDDRPLAPGPTAIDMDTPARPTLAHPNESGSKVDGVKMNPYPAPPLATKAAIRKATRRARVAPAAMNYRKVDDPKTNPYR